MPDGWQPAPVTPPEGVDLALELEKFRDWAASRGAVSADWQARWRNWLRNASPGRAFNNTGPGPPQSVQPFSRAHRNFPT